MDLVGWLEHHSYVGNDSIRIGTESTARRCTGHTGALCLIWITKQDEVPLESEWNAGVAGILFRGRCTRDAAGCARAAGKSGDSRPSLDRLGEATRAGGMNSIIGGVVGSDEVVTT